MVDSPVVENSVVENPVFTLVKFPSGAPLPPAALAELLRKITVLAIRPFRACGVSCS